MKKIFLLLILTLVSFALSAQEVQKDNVFYFFYSYKCPHCHEAQPFIAEIEKEYTDITFKKLEVLQVPENMKLFREMTQKPDYLILHAVEERLRRLTIRLCLLQLVRGNHIHGFGDFHRIIDTLYAVFNLNSICHNSFVLYLFVFSEPKGMPNVFSKSSTAQIRL